RRGGALDGAFEVRVPPHVVGVHHDPGGGAAGGLGDVEGLVEGGDHGAVRGEHGVQRLDRERHPALGGVRRELGDSLGDPGPGADDVLVGPVHPADDEHERRGAECGGLVDRAAVVVEGGGAVRLGGGGEEAAAAQAAHAQACVVDPSAQGVQAHLGDVLSPQAHGVDAAGGGGLEDVLDAGGAEGPAVQGQARGAGPPALGGRGVHAAAPDVTAVSISYPARRSIECQRSAASCGSSRLPVVAASSMVRERCGRLRAACMPPTMVKACWWPFSQARNATPVWEWWVGAESMWRLSTSEASGMRRASSGTPASNACKAAEAAGAVAAKAPSSASEYSPFTCAVPGSVVAVP